MNQNNQDVSLDPYKTIKVLEDQLAYLKKKNKKLCKMFSKAKEELDSIKKRKTW